MADQLGNLSPEEYAQQQQINRQQKMAEMLMSQNQQPQGQMVSGRFVAPSFFQNLQPVANMLTGAYLAKQGDTRAAALAEAIRGRNTKELQDVVQTMRGTPAQTGNLPLQGTTQAIGSIEEPVGEYKAPVAGIAGNKDLALMKALKSTSPIAANIANTLITEMVKPPEEFNLNEGQKRFRKGINGESIEIASGGGKAHVVGNSLIVDGKEVYKGQDKPVQIDTGTEIRFVDPLTGKVIYSTPKHHVFAPHAPQVIETANGPMLVNTYTGQASPIMANGQAIAPKLGAEQTKDIVGINQQKATIQGAIDAVKQNPKAFSFGRGLAQNLPAGETIAGRYESPEATQARAYVFNNVSAVIKERAGTAQSASEMQRINSFMPSTKDTDKQIIAKLNGFNQYLNDLEKGTRINPNAQLKPQPNTLITIKSDNEYDALPSGSEFIDPKGVKRRKP